MKVKTKIDCQCGFEIEVIMNKPDHFKGSVGSATCEGCESRYSYNFKRKWQGGKGALVGDVRCINPSDTLMMIMMEKQSEA